ncbi:MAG: hypothetical protein JRN35_08255 [Nitrososphaerota archaeon]|nr:hypothetical protein [Nitrososphaerota archaeon]
MTVDGNTIISSAMGRVASILAPRMTTPSDVLSATRAAMKGSTCFEGPTPLLTCGLMSVCVSIRSFSRTYS